MPAIDRESHQIGQAQERIVGQNTWPGLLSKNLTCVGLTDAGAGYDMQRPNPPTGHILVCHGGQGEVWIDGRWVQCVSGQAYVTPPLKPMAFRTLGKHRWQFAWAYMRAAKWPDDRVQAPILLELDTRPFVNALEGLYVESTRLRRIDRLDLWGELLSSYAKEIVTVDQSADPLWELWSDVDSRLSEPWTLDLLAESGGMSAEKLRTLSLLTMGCSPMRHVTHLRMRRAEALLTSTGAKVLSIAQQVGYQNGFAFSTAFRRWKGKSPRDCRRISHGDSPVPKQQTSKPH